MFQKKNNFVKNKEKHQFHLVDLSLLPFSTSTAAMLLVMSFVFYFHTSNLFNLHGVDDTVFHSSWLIYSGILFAWFYWVVIESGQGHHTWMVRNGLRFGMVLFIVSEVMFFFAFFWAFFHVSLSPAIAIGSIWPPKSIQSLDVWGLPLVNTILLLSSGITITFAHRAILKTTLEVWYGTVSKHLGATALLGAIFLFCQWIEYKYGIIFQWKENVYGTTFFVTTGFHGFHVSIGTIFLLFCLMRNLLTTPIEDSYMKQYINSISPELLENLMKFFGVKAVTKLEMITDKENINSEAHYLQKFLGKFSFRKNQHLGFESAAWYWHFVDVVWIFLFITVYWWGTQN